MLQRQLLQVWKKTYVNFPLPNTNYINKIRDKESSH